MSEPNESRADRYRRLMRERYEPGGDLYEGMKAHLESDRDPLWAPPTPEEMRKVDESARRGRGSE
jgi:hypothetical protein